LSNEFDVVIVGTGVAGALVAWKLAEAKFNVGMIDAGEKHLETIDRDEFVKKFSEAPQSGKSPSQPFVDDLNAKFAHSPDVADFKLFKDKKPGEDLYFVQTGDAPFLSQYQRIVGGTTWSWRGNCPRYIPSDFKLRTLYGRGVDWPIAYRDLESYYCDAEDALGVAGNHDEWNNLFQAYRSRRFPMKEIAQAYGDLQLKEAISGLSLDGVEIEILALPQARNSRDYDGRRACHGNSNCIPLCPIQAKYDATVHVKKALATKNATLIEKAVVTDLKTDPAGNISEVVYKTWDGQTQTVKGKIVVLATNGIETPKLLLMSNGRNGIANFSKKVGLHLMDHLGGEGNANLPFPVFPFRGPQSTSCIEAFRDHRDRDKTCAFRLTIGNDGWGRKEHPFDTLRKLLELNVFGKELQEDLLRTVSHQLRIAYSTEQLPDAKNLVKLSETEKDGFDIPKPEIQFSIDEYSANGFAYAQKVIRHIYTSLGVAESDMEFTDVKSPDLKKKKFSGSGHIMGTCRMGRSKNDSVVDAQCRSHDIENLYIVGSSVFPTGSCVNPTITIAALALRAAASIQKQLAP